MRCDNCNQECTHVYNIILHRMFEPNEHKEFCSSCITKYISFAADIEIPDPEWETYLEHRSIRETDREYYRQLQQARY